MKTISIHAHPRYKFIVKFLCESDSRITDEEARAIQAWEGYPPDRCGHYDMRLLGKRLASDDTPRFTYAWECQGRAPAALQPPRKAWGES